MKERLGSSDTKWMKSAACIGQPTHIFFPSRGESNAEAKAICETCPVRVECLEYAIDQSEMMEGVWGGLSRRARVRLKRLRRHKNIDLSQHLHTL